MHTYARSGAVLFAICLVALTSCGGGLVSSSTSPGAAAGGPGHSASANVSAQAGGGSLAEVLLPGSALPGGLAPVTNVQVNLGPAPNLLCRRVTEAFATSADITAGGDGIEIEISDCPTVEQRMPVTWLAEAAMYGQPNFTDVTAPAIIGPGSTAIAEVAAPAWFSPPTSSVRYVLVTWTQGIVVATVVGISHAPFASFASPTGVEALARLQAARISANAAILESCAGVRGVDARCGLG